MLATLSGVVVGRMVERKAVAKAVGRVVERKAVPKPLPLVPVERKAVQKGVRVTSAKRVVRVVPAVPAVRVVPAVPAVPVVLAVPKAVHVDRVVQKKKPETRSWSRARLPLVPSPRKMLERKALSKKMSRSRKEMERPKTPRSHLPMVVAKKALLRWKL